MGAPAFGIGLRMQQACCAGAEIASASGAIVPTSKSVSRTLATKRCMEDERRFANRIITLGVPRKPDPVAVLSVWSKPGLLCVLCATFASFAF